MPSLCEHLCPQVFPSSPFLPFPAPSQHPALLDTWTPPFALVHCVLFFLLQSSLFVLPFQMDIDEDTAEKFYEALLELEKRVRITIQKSDHPS